MKKAFILITVLVLFAAGCNKEAVKNDVEVDRGVAVLGEGDSPRKIGWMKDGKAPVAVVKKSSSVMVDGRVFTRGSLMQFKEADTHKVVKGECLWKIAGYKGVYDNPFRWPEIWKANRSKIKDPHWIYPGQAFVIPR